MALSGASHIQEIVKQCLNSQAFWTKRTNMVTGKVEPYKVQGVWRPIEFGHYVFPEENLNEVMHMLDIPGKLRTFEAIPYMDKYNMLMRKLLKLKKIPDMNDLPLLTDEQKQSRTIFLHEHTNIIPIGIKEDGRGPRDFGNGMVYNQEWL